MGHALFCMLHVGALLFGFQGLLLTVPLHLIYTALRPSARAEPAAALRACPACKESIRADAVKCKHCGTEVTPLMANAAELPPMKGQALLVVGTVVVFAVLGLIFFGR